jgi:superfamily I DNA/RNA helicase
VADHLNLFLLTVDEPDQDNTIALVCDALLPDTAAPIEDLRAVLFLTMHGSKGLTKKTVVLPGLEQAWLPGGATGEDLGERRRLFYVALTRATDRVLITVPHTRGRSDTLNFDAPGRGEVSTFIADAGLNCVYHE